MNGRGNQREVCCARRLAVLASSRLLLPSSAHACPCRCPRQLTPAHAFTSSRLPPALASSRLPLPSPAATDDDGADHVDESSLQSCGA